MTDGSLAPAEAMAEGYDYRAACPACGDPGFLVYGIRRCGNYACEFTDEFNPGLIEQEATDDR